MELNKKVQAYFKGIFDLKIIKGATHIFPKPEKLQSVAKEICYWFTK